MIWFQAKAMVHVCICYWFLVSGWVDSIEIFIFIILLLFSITQTDILWSVKNALRYRIFITIIFLPFFIRIFQMLHLKRYYSTRLNLLLRFSSSILHFLFLFLSLVRNHIKQWHFNNFRSQSCDWPTWSLLDTR